MLAPERAAVPVRFIDAGDFAPQESAERPAPPGDLDQARAVLREAMSRDAGVIRDSTGLASLVPILRRTASAAARAEGIAAEELKNLVEVASSLAAGALARRETRGVHTRSDAPKRDDAHFRVRVAVRRTMAHDDV